MRLPASPLVLLIPALLIVGLGYVVPLGQIAWLSVHGSELSGAAYRALLGDDIRLFILGRTLWIAGVVTALSLVIGYPMAYVLARAPERWRPVLLLLVVMPLWTSILVRSYAWMATLGRQGIVNALLQAIGLTDAPLPMLYTRFSVYVGMIHIMLPFMILPILNALRQIEPRLAAAASSLGAGRGAVFFLVTLPLSLPGVAAGTALVFILSVGFFVTPALLGGATDTTFVMLIDRYVNALRDWEQAAAMSILLLAVTLAIVLLTNWRPGTGGTPQPAVPGGARPLTAAAMRVAVATARLRGPAAMRKEAQGRIGREPPAGPMTLLLAGLGFVFLTAPIVIILLLAFSDAPFLQFPPPAYSLRWFANYFARPDWMAATQNSLEAAIGTMLAATIAGTLAAIALVRLSFPGRGLVLALLVSPAVVPTMVLAIGLYYVLARVGLVGSTVGLVIGHSVLAIPYVVIVMAGALRGLDPVLERAAQTLGASPVTAFRRIALPQLRPALLTAALFAFLASFDELVIALFISGTGQKTLPKRMWEGIREEIDPTTAAVAAMLILVSLLLLGASELARALARRAQERRRMG